ncbi:MAG TPA: beta-phosphoglucomutase, partial [Flammeovirgaceae bacterium]|nr:beta-phosphoglucomutase [Flammeovirgaceae bacterium]
MTGTTNHSAFIFDLDGVLVDTARYHFLAWQRLAQELGIPFSEKDNERLKGVSRMQSLQIILELGNRQLPQAEKETLAARKNAWYLDYISHLTPRDVLPGVVDFLEAARKKSIRMAVGSASKNAMTILE